MTNNVVVNESQCRLIAERLEPLQFRKDHFDRPFLAFPADEETKLRAYLFAAAICHQTHTLVNKRKNLKGWSCLEDVYMALGKANSRLLDPAYLAKLGPEELSGKLKPLFADDGNPENCTLDRLVERSNFLIQTSKLLNEKYDGKVRNLLVKSNGFLLNGGTGLYEILEKFEAYADPLRKKSTVFVQTIIGADLFSVKDPESIEPTMDYHMQRLLLRTGCVDVLDESLRKSLLLRAPLSSDDDVRKSCVEAVRIMAVIAKKNYFEMDELLWSLGRSCCKDKTLCRDGVCNQAPCTFHSFVDIPEHVKCVFDGVCKGKSDESYRKLWQPVVDTHYY
ncbi:Uncharacterised protein [uncultured archaeon]|nr:Uncharacterised protein [uncultured archaeon]